MAMSGLDEAMVEPADVTVVLSHQDLRLVRSALEEFLASFSHEQGELVGQIKDLLRRLPDDERPAGQPRSLAAFRLTL